MAHHTDALLSIKQINKEFSGVRVLNDINIDINGGEVFGILGENGAGKSTMMKVLSGIYHKDSGRILYKGQEVEIPNPKAAQQLGISIIHQELNLVVLILTVDGQPFPLKYGPVVFDLQ